jgi:hypothetical protein
VDDRRPRAGEVLVEERGVGCKLPVQRVPIAAEEVEKLSWGLLLDLAGENAEALGLNGSSAKPSES